MTKLERRKQPHVITKDIVVLYHGNCTDGFTAAWAAWKKFGKKAEYIPVEHQVPPPEGLTNKEIYLLDFVYLQPIIDQLVRGNIRVTALDHHVTDGAVTKSTHEGWYDNLHSGAMLSWLRFHPNEPASRLVRFVEDYDLHRFALPETRQIIDWLDLFDFDFKVFTKLARMLDTEAGLKRAVRQGSLIGSYREKQIQNIIENYSYNVDFGGHRVRAVNSEIYHGEIATQLAHDHPFGIVWRVRPPHVYISLRSEGDFHVGEFAKNYGGGGHAHSAGILIPSLSELPFHPVSDE